MKARAAMIVIIAAGCAAAPRAVLRTGAAQLGREWTRIGAGDANVALHHRDGGTLAAGFACDAVDEDAPLEVLVRHVLLELEAPVEHDRTRLTIDGRAALRVALAAKLDGVPVELELVVFKKDGCVVDAQLVSDAERFPARRAAFEQFIAALALTRSRP